MSREGELRETPVHHPFGWCIDRTVGQPRRADAAPLQPLLMNGGEWCINLSATRSRADAATPCKPLLVNGGGRSPKHAWRVFVRRTRSPSQRAWALTGPIEHPKRPTGPRLDWSPLCGSTAARRAMRFRLCAGSVPSFFLEAQVAVFTVPKPFRPTSQRSQTVALLQPQSQPNPSRS